MPPLDATMWAYAVLVAVLIAAAVDDVRTGKIHNWLTYPAAVIGIAGHCFLDGVDIHGRPLGVAGAVVGLLVGFGPMFLAWRAGGVGGGDAKLMGAVGALTGWKFALATMLCGFVIAGLMAIIVTLRRRILRRTIGRIWWFLVQAVLRNKPDDPSSEDSPQIAIGLALAFGGSIVVADALFKGPMANWLFGAG